MCVSFPLTRMYPAGLSSETRERSPAELAKLLSAPPGQEVEDAWAEFLASYTGLLLKVATAFGPGYDEVLDRYLFMLEELRRSDYRRLRAFAADGRGRFSTWLTVVAQRLCLDHYRRSYGRVRGDPSSVAFKRALQRLDSAATDLDQLPADTRRDPADELDHREQRDVLRTVLNELTPQDRHLVRLRFEHELTARQMATRLGLRSPFQVYRRLEIIYREVRVKLGRSGHSPCAGMRTESPDRKRRLPVRVIRTDRTLRPVTTPTWRQNDSQ